jgi:hypothetical protein
MSKKAESPVEVRVASRPLVGCAEHCRRIEGAKPNANTKKG